MKAIITILFIFFLGTNLQAQEAAAHHKAETIETGLVIKTQLLFKMEVTGFEVLQKEVELARLYRRADYRGKKALGF
mgnify:FL=1